MHPASYHPLTQSCLSVLLRELGKENANDIQWNGPKQYEDKSTKSLMMLPTDMALIEDKEFRKHVERYAKDDQVFFKEFSDVIMKLLELGVPFQSREEDRMNLAPLE